MAKAKSKTKKINHDLPPAYDWRKEIESSQAEIYLLHGEEAMFSHQAAFYLHKKALGNGIPDFNLDRFDASDSVFSVSALVNALNTQPMMSDRRVVWVQAAELLNKQAKPKLDDLISYCAEPNPQTCLILEARDKFDQTRALFKALQKSQRVLIREASPLTIPQVEKWLVNETKNLGLSASQEALNLIQESGDGRISEMSDTLSKLALFIEPRKEIHLDDVINLLPEARMKTTVWVLLDKLALKQTSDVIALAHSLLTQGQEVLGIVALVHKRLRELLAAKSVLQLGGGDTLLAQSLKINQYAAKRIIRLAQDRRCMSPSEIAEGYLLLSWTDKMLKGAKVEPALLLEHVLLKLCTQ